MIHGPKVEPRLGFAPAEPATDWHWLIIAALAAVVVFQAMTQNDGRKKR